VRKKIIFAATFLGGLFFVVTFMCGELAPESFDAAESRVLEVLQIVGALAVGMGLVSIGMVHGKRLVFLKKNWQYSLALFVGLVVALVAGLTEHYTGSEAGGFWHTLYTRVVYDALITNLGSSMFSLLALFMVSASYRAFRVRSPEAGLMMASALVVMLAQMPPVQVAVPGIVYTKQWILDTINTGAQRAILIGSGLAGLVVALRMWLGVERGSFFDQH
jgi:hypothetical protein